jgi:hypothetical protein
MGLTPDEAAMPKARSVFPELARLLGEQPFFAGEAISLADLFVRPQLLHQTPEWLALVAPRQDLVAWLARMEELEQSSTTVDDCTDIFIPHGRARPRLPPSKIIECIIETRDQGVGRHRDTQPHVVGLNGGAVRVPCAQRVQWRFFATKFAYVLIRPCRRVALVAWPGPDAGSSWKLTLRRAASSRRDDLESPSNNDSSRPAPLTSATKVG